MKKWFQEQREEICTDGFEELVQRWQQFIQLERK
jgi:hypothetical protein